MENLKRIKGMDLLLQKLPKKYQHWHLFGTILDFHYQVIFDSENKFEEIVCISMILTDKENNHRIKVDLIDVIGNIAFDVINGFYSGLTITDCRNECIEHDWETSYCFHVTSSEQDVDFEIQCENISVEMLD